MNNYADNPIVLYDGICGLCNRLNQFLLKRDRHDRVRFASLQSDFARQLLQRHAKNPDDLDTVYIVLNHGTPKETLLDRSDAILAVVSALGGFWRFCKVGRILPRFVRNVIYNFVARNRYQVFGQYDTCLLPEPRHRRKFIDI